MPVVALCVVGLRRPFAFACPTCSFTPAALHSHHPRYPLLSCRARTMQFCSVAALASSGSICTEPHSPPELHWLYPRRGTRRKTRMVFALLPALPESGQDYPAFPARPTATLPDAGEMALRNRLETPPSRACCSAASSRIRAVAAEYARRPTPT